MTIVSEILSPLQERGIALADVARLAGLHVTHVYDLVKGRKAATAATISRLRFAVARLKTRQTDGELDATVCYRMCLALTAQALGLDPALVQVADPSAKQSFIKEWRQAAEARRLAQYLMNTGLNYRQTDVARAAGVTKQAINQAMTDIENRREDPAFDAIVSRLELWILGVP